MYLRTTQRKNKDGTIVRYVQLAHNRRDGHSTTAEVLVNFGREDTLDLDGLRRLVRSINRYLGEDGSADLADAAGEGLRVAASRQMGTAYLLDCLWHALGVDEALSRALGRRRFTVDMERVLFALVANRAIDPSSKLAASSWATKDVAIAGLDQMDEDQAYRAMDLLVTADAQGEVQEQVFFSVADLLNLEVDLLFFDTTSTYFELDDEDQGGEGFRVLGHSKDHRTDLPQVVIGLAVTKEGIPVRVWSFSGDTSDQTILKGVRDDLRHWRLGRVITVVDRGFSSNDNLAYLTRGGGHYICGEKMRDGSADAKAALSRPGRYRVVRDNLEVKEVRLGPERSRRFVVCHNPKEADKDRAEREEKRARIEAEIARIAAARERDRKQKKRASDEVHARAECALRDHKALGRYVRQLASGRLVVDRHKVHDEERLDGKYLLSTSDPELSADEIALGYKNLLEAERGFRDLKSTLLLRPVFHRLEDRIRAHVLLCWLALLLIRVAERRSQTTWRQIATELRRVHAVELCGPAGSVVQTTPLTSQQAAILSACGVAKPPAMSVLHPADQEQRLTRPRASA
jgi:transposase